MSKYIAFHHGQQTEVHAETETEAKEAAAEVFHTVFLSDIQVFKVVEFEESE